MAIKSAKQPDEKMFLIKIMDWLETMKKTHKDNDLIINDTVAQAYLENYAHKLFSFADARDRNADFGKNVVKSFYTSAMLYDVIGVFGVLSEEANQSRKYAKWKAAYIHNCLKNGETPHAGPLPVEGEDDLVTLNYEANDPGTSSSFGWNTNPASHQPQPSQQQFPSQPPAAAAVNVDHNDPFSNFRAPSPPKDPEEKNPGGFIPYNPSTSNISSYDPTPKTSSGLTSEQMMKAQKYCKYAGSALTYDDVGTAIDNLQKALRLLTTGQDS